MGPCVRLRGLVDDDATCMVRRVTDSGPKLNSLEQTEANFKRHYMVRRVTDSSPKLNSLEQTEANFKRHFYSSCHQCLITHGRYVYVIIARGKLMSITSVSVITIKPLPLLDVGYHRADNKYYLTLMGCY